MLEDERVGWRSVGGGDGYYGEVERGQGGLNVAKGGGDSRYDVSDGRGAEILEEGLDGHRNGQVFSVDWTVGGRGLGHVACDDERSDKRRAKRVAIEGVRVCEERSDELKRRVPCSHLASRGGS